MRFGFLGVPDHNGYDWADCGERWNSQHAGVLRRKYRWLFHSRDKRSARIAELDSGCGAAAVAGGGQWSTSSVVTRFTRYWMRLAGPTT